MKYVNLLLINILILSFADYSIAKSFLYHATSRAIARKIKKKGFSAAKMKARSRLGKGVYFSRTPKTAIMERQKADSLVRVSKGKSFNRKVINLRKPTPKKIKSFIKVKDLRGSTKKGVIGPKLGRKVGKSAGNKNKIIRYRSSKNPKGTNYFVPRNLYKKNPRIIRTIQIKDGKSYR
jgi:hypothetical protein